MNKIIYKSSSVLFLTLAISSCVPALVVGTTAAVGTTIAQEKPTAAIFSDNYIWTQINKKFLSPDSELFNSLTIKVTEGRVLLTGSISTPEKRVEAAKLVWEVNGVKEVINDITIKTGEQFTISQLAGDTYITTQIRAQLTLARNIRSLNYSIETIQGEVYIMGIGKSKEELDKVSEIAAKTSGVKKVINYARLADSPLRTK